MMVRRLPGKLAGFISRKLGRGAKPVQRLPIQRKSPVGMFKKLPKFRKGKLSPGKPGAPLPPTFPKQQAKKSMKPSIWMGAALGGVGAAVAGSHVASYKINKKRAQRGEGPSLHFAGVSGVMGYRAGMKKSKKR